MSSRKIEDLIPEMRNKYKEFEKQMKKEKIDYIVTSTKRLQSEQDALYAQGRSKPGPIVTWTKKSKHIDGEAFDIVLLRNGKLNWDVSDPAWKKAGEIGCKLGLRWGGNFPRTRDFPHFEFNGKVKA